MMKEREAEEAKAIKAVAEVKSSTNTDGDFSPFSPNMPLRGNPLIKPDSDLPDISKMQNQIQADFDKLRNSVERDVMGDFEQLKSMFEKQARPPTQDRPGLDTRDRGMVNVDMMDVEELEKARDREERPKEVVPVGLSTEQKELIDEIFTEKTNLFVADIKE